MFQITRKKKRTNQKTLHIWINVWYCECCVQFWFPASPERYSKAGEDSEVVMEYDKSPVGSFYMRSIKVD